MVAGEARAAQRELPIRIWRARISGDCYSSGHLQTAHAACQGLQQEEIWLESPTLNVLGELKGHWKELKALLDSVKITGGAIHEASFAVICREHGVQELWSADRDFGCIGRYHCAESTGSLRIGRDLLSVALPLQAREVFPGRWHFHAGAV
jgi:hypothetical protein